jgi:hypothetical protein
MYVKYFTEIFSNIEVRMNEWINDNPDCNILTIHINQEQMIEGEICVNGYITYE